MSWFESKEIARKASKYATKQYVDEEKSKAFSAGVEWTLGQFYKMLSVHPMERGGSRILCNQYRLKDFQDLVDQLSKKADE